jgi:hypothetical protein
MLPAISKATSMKFEWGLSHYAAGRYGREKSPILAYSKDH